MAPLSWLCSSRGFPSCQVWWAELQMGPKGVAEPHCLKPMPCPSPFPQAPGCLPAPKKPRGWPRPFLPALSQLRPGINTRVQGRLTTSLQIFNLSRDRCVGLQGRTGHGGGCSVIPPGLPPPLQNIFHLLPLSWGLGGLHCCPLPPFSVFYRDREASL